ncbi:hypothetical protein EPA93_48045 [Ktedonosporobacter rubrisoli]|uniref:Copper resistance protein D domain-containing protein n=1 Tax=Ktedonosporobacter rubrisoli TaxID=2509675 RepID=A0A4P6K4P5_KTERU|nr:CopD family protein [Ktedonosporobacter rubrisoli]QBD83307.1 hypothetical protein EPA93_48045 [Ktedonosporobacter rubrisoli]
MPKFNGSIPVQNTLGGNSTRGSTGQPDGPMIFSFLMVTLVDLGSVFWVGAQFWRVFVSRAGQEEQRFERRFALPTLLLILFANVGVLVGQGLVLASGQALSSQILFGLVSNGRFGVYWTLRKIVVVLALLLTITVFFARKSPHLISVGIAWINLALALVLLLALALSGHAAAANSNMLVPSVLVDWLHLLAASLWIGGMMYIATIYLPLLKKRSLKERINSLLSTLPRYSPLAITGVVIMAVSGPFNATVHMNSWEQLISTAYGRVLVIKVLLVCAMLVTSAIHVRIFRPRLAKDYARYRALTSSLEMAEKTEKGSEHNQEDAITVSGKQHKQLECALSRQTARLVKTLRWEPLLGVGVLLCTGLLNIFAGTLLPATPVLPASTLQQTTSGKPFSATIRTRDRLFTAQLHVSPDHFGPNTFTVHVLEKNGKSDTNVGVSLYVTMLDMDMGTTALNLQPDHKGGFSADGDLDMTGHWQIRVEIRTPDFKLHEGEVRMIMLT